MTDEELIARLRAVTDDRLSRAYSERTAAAVGMARFALMCGYRAGVGKDGNEAWDDEWRVVLYVDTPAGQVSWHIAPPDQHLLAGLPEYEGDWDGTFRSRDGSFAVWEHTRAYREIKDRAAPPDIDTFVLENSNE